MSVRINKDKLKKNTILLKELVRTDFKLRYQGSVLGIFWSVLKPLAMFVVMYFVFVHFLRFGAGIPHFAVSLLLAIVLWNFFAETTSQGMQSLVNRGGILRRINIPKYIIVVSTSVSAFINLFISFIIVLIFAILNGVEFHWTALLIIPLVIELYVLALALAMFFSVLYVKYRDLSHIWDVISQTIFYFTPIIYPPSMVADMSVAAAKVIMVSPIAQIVQDARHSLVTYETETIWNFIENPYIQIAPIVFVVVIFVLATIYFKRNTSRLTEMI